MTINTLTTPQKIAYISIAASIILAFVLAICLVIFIPIRNRKKKSDFKYFYYKTIYKIAMDRDYYLINNFLFKIDESYVARIDHILFGDKYIYLITDSYFDGDITGKEDDTSIIRIESTGKKYYDNNPIVTSKKLLTKLSMVTGIDPSMMIGVSLINSECRSDIKTTGKQFYIIQVNKLKSLVKAIESRDIDSINAEQLASAVKAINKLNRKRKK